MGFWIYMLLMDLLIPLTMLGFGLYCAKGGPKDISAVFGYRTRRSMRNRDTWEFAHRHCGKVWRVCGLILLPLSVIPMLFVLGRGEEMAGTVGGIVCCVQLAVLIGSIFPTEMALKREFNEKGERR